MADSTLKNLQIAGTQVNTASQAYLGTWNSKTNTLEGGVRTEENKGNLDRAWAALRKAYEALSQKDKDSLATLARGALGGAVPTKETASAVGGGAFGGLGAAVDKVEQAIKSHPR